MCQNYYMDAPPWMLMKYMKKKVDKSNTRILCAVLNKS